MPIWVKIAIFMLLMIPLERWIINAWVKEHIIETLERKYPIYIIGITAILILSYLSFIPVIFWLIFLR